MTLAQQHMITVIVRQTGDEADSKPEDGPLFHRDRPSRRRSYRPPPSEISGEGDAGFPGNREAIPVCALVPATIIGLADPVRLEKLGKALSIRGAAYSPDGCADMHANVLPEGLLWVDPAVLIKVRDQLIKSGELIQWRTIDPRETADAGTLGDDYYEKLQGETARSAETLKDAVYLRSLLAEELKRLGPFAVNIEQARRRKLVFLTLQQTWEPSHGRHAHRSSKAR